MWAPPGNKIRIISVFFTDISYLDIGDPSLRLGIGRLSHQNWIFLQNKRIEGVGAGQKIADTNLLPLALASERVGGVTRGDISSSL